jgi:uncharacterized membrane protein YvlD (DUF360 family)
MTSVVKRVVAFYAMQIRLLWHWQGGIIAASRRLVVTLVVASVSFAIAAFLTPGFSMRAPYDGAFAVILLTGFNVLIRPLVVMVFVPWSLVITAVVAVVLQVAAFFTIAAVSPGVQVDGLLPAIIGSFVYGIVNAALTWALGVDRGGSYFGYLVQTLQARRAAAATTRPGLVVIQIDGLAHGVLSERVRAGSVTTMASWIRSKSHRLSRWHPLLPTMTSASQMGILYGSDREIPAFRWFDRDRQRVVVSSNPVDAADLDRRASNGAGLLSNDGVSICNLLTGGAARAYVTTAALSTGARGLGESQAFWSFFLNPSSYLRMLALFIGELGKERIATRRDRRQGLEPRLDRDIRYAVMRAASNVVLRDLNVTLIIEEMYRGANVIYADFTDYDEIAHHSGPERVEAFDALDGIDRAIRTIAKAATDAPRPYRFVVLSDHGQTLGATFRQRFGESVGDVVERLIGAPTGGVAEATQPGEGHTFANALLSELVRGSGAVGSMARTALRAKTESAVVDVNPTDDLEHASDARAVVLGSGNLGLVYFPGGSERLDLEDIEQRYPNLVAGLVSHPGVGLVLAHSRAKGGIAVGRDGACYLADGRVEGRDPVRRFGPQALAGLRHEDSMKSAPDLLLLSAYDPDLGEVAAFEELIGSHGGLGGPQSDAFILYPHDWALDERTPLGAPAIYRNLRRWLSDIGIELGAQAPTITS